MMHGQKPNALCAHPERYTSVDMQATENEVIELVAALVRSVHAEYAIETGTYRGYAAKAIGEALIRNGHGRLDTIEIDEGNARAARAACEGLPVTVHHTSSLAFIPPEPIEFAWLDSRVDLRAKELQRFRRHFAPNAVVAVHDTGTRFSTRQYLEPVEADGWIRFVYLPTFRGVAIGTVR